MSQDGPLGKQQTVGAMNHGFLHARASIERHCEFEDSFDFLDAIHDCCGSVRRDCAAPRGEYRGEECLLPARLASCYPVNAGVHDTPTADVRAVLDRSIAESSAACLWSREQPSLVDCEPGGNPVNIHGRRVEGTCVARGKSLFVDESLPLGSRNVQKPHATGPPSVLLPWVCRRFSAFSTTMGRPCTGSWWRAWASTRPTTASRRRSSPRYGRIRRCSTTGTCAGGC